MKQDYRLNILDAQRAFIKKTLHVELAVGSAKPVFKGARKVSRLVSNQKTRPVVKKRLAKLTKYVRMAWAGYQYGQLKKKVAS